MSINVQPPSARGPGSGFGGPGSGPGFGHGSVETAPNFQGLFKNEIFNFSSFCACFILVFFSFSNLACRKILKQKWIP